jgi:DUF1365 family protein
MNSSLYKAQVMHHRLEPKNFQFHYNVFMFYIDLDELEMLSKKFWFISRNKFNVFAFRDKDHLQLPRENPDKTRSTKEHILDYLKANGVELKAPKIMLLTNLCTFGYQFNPVSFYFISETFPSPVGEGPGLRACIAEISNTFHEMKPYFIGKECFDGNKFQLNTAKFFYVSPFSEMDSNFDFNLGIPEEKLNIRIDSFGKEKRFFISTLTGTKKELTNAKLAWYALRFPFITMQIILLIHWNALKLWIKKIRYYKKEEYKELQRDVYKPYKE